MSEADDAVLVPLPESGRVYRDARRVRLGDSSPGGRLRYDAVARYLQDIANDDAVDSGLTDALGWVVRRTVVEVHQPGVFNEMMHLATFCGGTGRGWAQRRTSIAGDRGGHVECVALWVQIDLETGRPRALGDDFLSVYGEASGGRKVRARLHHGDPPGDAVTFAWPVRFADFDVFNHVNNAAYWELVEEHLAGSGLRGPIRLEMEHRRGLERSHNAEVRSHVSEDGAAWWLVDDDGVFSSATIRRMS